MKVLTELWSKTAGDWCLGVATVSRMWSFICAWEYSSQVKAAGLTRPRITYSILSEAEILTTALTSHTCIDHHSSGPLWISPCLTAVAQADHEIDKLEGANLAESMHKIQQSS